MTSTPEPDERLLAAESLALAAIHEITSPETVGASAGYVVEDDGVVSWKFQSKLEGYPGWFWTASLAALDDAEPTVLEVELLPGEAALLAPEWVPWAERLADYQAAQAALAEQAAAEADADDSDDDDVDEDDLDDTIDVDEYDLDDTLLDIVDDAALNEDESDDDLDEDDSEDEDDGEEDDSDEDDSDEDDSDENERRDD